MQSWQINLDAQTQDLVKATSWRFKSSRPHQSVLYAVVAEWQTHQAWGAGGGNLVMVQIHSTAPKWSLQNIAGFCLHFATLKRRILRNIVVYWRYKKLSYEKCDYDAKCFLKRMRKFFRLSNWYCLIWTGCAGGYGSRFDRLQRILIVLSCEEFELDLPAGKPLAVLKRLNAVCQWSKDTFADIPPAVYGRPIKTIFTPIYGIQGEVIGTLSSGIDFQNSLQLIKTIEDLAADTTQASESTLNKLLRA